MASIDDRDDGRDDDDDSGVERSSHDIELGNSTAASPHSEGSAGDLLLETNELSRRKDVVLNEPNLWDRVFSMRTLTQQFPPLEWSKLYKDDWKTHLLGDVFGGFTCGVMLIPQGMAYSLIARLPPVHGLYASFIPPIVYALLGTSRQLSVGPVALVSLLTAEGVSLLADPESSDPDEKSRYILLAGMLALQVGVLQFVLGALRFGFFTNFLSHPVISGFTSASALIIGSKQLKYVFGVKVESGEFIHTLGSFFSNLGDTVWQDVLLALMTFAILTGLKVWKQSKHKWADKAKLIPGALVVVVLGIIIAELANSSAIKVVGEIPQGLPSASWPSVSGSDFVALIPTAALISLIGFVESIAVAQHFAREHQYSVDSNQELIGLGLANFFGSFFSIYPVTGGFSRTAVSDQAGSLTPGNTAVTGIVMMVVLLVLTPLFENLPNAVLGAIVIQAVAGLFKVSEVKHIWTIKRQDVLPLLVTFAATLFVGVEIGLGIGVLISLLVVIHRASYPHIAVLGRKPNSEVYRDVDFNDDALTIPAILIIRFDASLYFGNAQHVRQYIDKAIETRRANGHPEIRAVIVDSAGINDVDSSGAEQMVELNKYLKRCGKSLFIARPKKTVRDVLNAAGLEQRFTSLHEAVKEAQTLLGSSPEKDAPPAV